MATYSKRTGTTGTMYIVDNGTTVEFIVDAGQTGTYNNRLPWRYTINGSTSAWQYYNLTSGGGQRSLGKWTVTTTQNVIFELGDTGTQGLGGPTSFTANITRSGVPPKPDSWTYVDATDTTITGRQTNLNNGGYSIVKAEVGIFYQGTSIYDASAAPNVIQIINNDGSGTLTGLTPNTQYYLKVRYTNTKGVGAWSDAISVKTGVRPITRIPTVSNITNTSATVSIVVDDAGGAGIPVLEYQIGYGITRDGMTSFVNSSTANLTNLEVGRTYYFRGRARNKYGWGEWSPANTNGTTAGVWFYYQGQPIKAVPYIKVDGVWKPTVPMVKIAGLWKPSG